MGREVMVHLPERVWTTLVNLVMAPDGSSLPAAVRQRLRDAVETRSEPVPAALRLVTLTREDADVLESWLGALCSRPDCPRDCRTALDLVREGKRLSS